MQNDSWDEAAENENDWRQGTPVTWLIGPLAFTLDTVRDDPAAAVIVVTGEGGWTLEKLPAVRSVTVREATAKSAEYALAQFKAWAAQAEKLAAGA